MQVSSAVLTCDYLEYRSSENVIMARGNAVLVSSGARLSADEILLDMDERKARASGRVSLTDGGVTILSNAADFDWEKSQGVFTDGYFEDPPYRLWARRMIRISTDTYHMEHAAVTSCDLNPPHYHVRIASMEYVPGKRASVWWPRFALQDTSVLGLPYFSKTFREKPWALTVDPGRSSYHGLYAKSILSYRMTEHGTARLYWDHFTNTGEGFGAEYTYGAPNARGTVYGYRTDDRVSDTKRWNARLVHWQQIRPKLILEINGLTQSDAGFNNLYFNDDLFRVRTQVQSAAALSYKHPFYTTRFSARHDREFDPLRGVFVTAKTVAPELSFQSSPWKLARDTYLKTAFAVRNEYVRPSTSPLVLNPLVPDKDRFRGTGEASFDVTRTLALGKRLSLEPSVGADGVWQSWRDLGTTRDPNDFVQGSGFTRWNLRHRLTRKLDHDTSYIYRVRWSPHQVKRDHAAADQGLETHEISWLGSYRGRSLTGRLGTGYDLRDPDGQSILTPRQKVIPPVLDLYWRPAPGMSLTFREVYDLFPAQHPQTSQFSWRMTGPRGLQFSSGFSYNGDLPGELLLRHGIALQVTKGWAVEAIARYLAKGSGGMSYDSIPKERFEQEYVVRRDLHCWATRINFRRRPGLYEAYVRLDLKTQAAARQQLESPAEKQYYPGRDGDR